MSRTWLVTVLLVALCTLAGLAALLSLQSQPSITPFGSAVPATPDDAPVAVQGTVIAAETTADPALPPERTSGAVAAVADQRQALLEVFVELVEPAAATRQPFVEVALALDGEASMFTARTNARGVATFELAGADGRTGVARCALGAAAQVVLSAAQPARITLSVRPRVIVRGTVVDATGRGVGDAALLLLPWPRDDDDVPAIARVGRSDADGSFRIGLAAGGRFGAHHRAYGSSGMYAVRAAGPEQVPPIATLQLALPTSVAGIAGTVRDHAGAPVAGAELELRSSGAPPRGADLRAPPQRVRSAKDGSFAATGLAPGPTDYAVRAAGHGRLAGRVQIGAGENARVDVRLPLPAALLGKAQTRDGAPIAKAIVVAGTPGTFLAATATTDAEGNFRLADLAPGPTPLRARGQIAADGSIGRAIATQDLVAGDGNEWNPVLCTTAAELRGVVVDATGSPLAGWRVTVRVGGTARDVTTSGADGSFALAPGPEPRVDLRAYAPGRSFVHFADALLRGVARDSTDVRLSVPANRFGRVLARVQTRDQLAIPATISCWHHERGEQARFVAAADGSVDLDEVPAGTVDTMFEYPGHAAVARTDLTVARQLPVDLGTIVLGAAGTLLGTVRGPDGRAPAECQLTILANEMRLPADYNAGAYRFAGAPVGEHVLQVQGPGFAADTFKVVIEANVEKQHDVVLVAGAQRRVRIQAPRETGTLVSLAMRPRTSQLVWMATTSPTPDGGIAEFTACLQPGEYEAIAWTTVRGTRWEARRTLTFGVGDDGDVLLTLAQR